MKNLFLLITAVFLFTGLQAQNSDINRLVETYRGEEDVVSLYIPGFLCRLAANLGDCSCEEEELLRSIHSVRILVIENPEINKKVNFVDQINQDRWGDNYQLMLSVSEKDEEVRIYSNEKDGKVRELIILVGGEENVLVCIKGKMNTDLLSALGGVIDVKAAELTSEL